MYRFSKTIVSVSLILLFIQGCKPAASLNTARDLCKETAAAAEKTTAIANTAPYRSAVAEILHAATDRHEHAVALGMTRNDSIIRSVIQPGTRNNSRLPVIEHPLADLHNHPENKPPSSGDIYALIDKVTETNKEYIKFILLPDKTVYALVITDLENAIRFNKNHPRVSGIKEPATNTSYQPTFPGIIVDQLNELKGWGGATEEAAIVWLLQEYQTGISLLKKDSDNIFKKLRLLSAPSGQGPLYHTVHYCGE